MTKKLPKKENCGSYYSFNRYIKTKDCGWIQQVFFGTWKQYLELMKKVEKQSKKPNKKYLYPKYYGVSQYQLVDNLKEDSFYNI